VTGCPRRRIVHDVPYATRPMHDADSHIMEPADWLHPYLDAGTRERFPLVWTNADEDTTPIDAVERALHAGGFHPALAHEAVRWAKEQADALHEESLPARVPRR